MKFIILLFALLQVQTPLLDQLLKEIESLRLKVPVPVPNIEVTVSTPLQLQTALDSYVTIIRLTPGTYTGNFTIKKKSTPIVVKGIDFSGRATPTNVYPKLVALDKLTAVLRTVDAANDYTFVGIEFTGVAIDRSLIEIGVRGETTVEQLPKNITFSQCYIHGVDGFGHVGLNINAVNAIITKNYISGFVELGRDSQGIVSTNGAGPYLIDDNYVEASGENIMFGGNDPTIPNLIPSDITVINNTLYKNPEWKTKSIDSGVKNLFELKNAKNVVIRGNTMENVWTAGQSGSAVLFTVRNQYGKCPWCNVFNVDFSCNVVRNVGNFAISVLGTDNNFPSGTANNITINNNLIENAFQGISINGGFNYSITSNVMVGLKNKFLELSGSGTVADFKMTKNKVSNTLYGIAGDGTVAMGMASLLKAAPGAIFTENVIERVGATPPYPAGNFIVGVGSVKAADWSCK